MADRVTPAAALVLAAAFACAAHAAPFADPTRPPDAVEPVEGRDAGASGPRLESILIAPNRRLAVISGQTVQLGGRFGEARVVRITESEVVLRSGDQLETLKLFPGVEKQPRARRANRTIR